MASLTGLHRRGPAAGFVTVFPDGSGRVWNDSRGGGALKRREGIDDVGFLQALVAQLSSESNARSENVYLVGISNGGFLVEHLARHDLLPTAGIALVAGAGTIRSRSARPVPSQSAMVVIFAGTADPLVPYTGGPIGPAGRMLQRRGEPDRGFAVAAETIAANWAIANGIESGPDEQALSTSAGDLGVTRMLWHDTSKPSVTLYRIDGGGHTWPGGSQYLPARFIGPTARSLDASAIVLEQFGSQELGDQ
jgi:polyhydroxybutyrate depolymerase